MPNPCDMCGTQRCYPEHCDAYKEFQISESLKTFGYAKGNYMCICIFCKKHHIADKRATTCYECAKKRLEELR